MSTTVEECHVDECVATAESGRAFFEASIEAQMLTKLLGSAEPGDVVTFDQMEDAAGMDCRSGRPGYSKLGSARKRILKEKGFVFASVAGEGLRRCHEHEKPKVMAALGDRIHRTARSASKVGASVDVSQLSNTDKSEFFVRASQMGALMAFTTTRAVKKLGAAVAAANDKLPITKAIKATLEAFK